MEYKFLHKGISRMKAEELLLTRKEDGVFLVRESESVQGAYTLCLLHHGRVSQYRVLSDAEGKLGLQCEEGAEFRKYIDLTQLIHELTHRGTNNGLACALKEPISPPTYDEFDEIEEDLEIEGSYEPVPFTPIDIAHRSGVGKWENTYVAKILQKRFATLDLSSHDGEFIDLLRKYTEDGVREDIGSATNNTEKLPELQLMLGNAAKDLEKQLKIYLSKLDAIKILFGQKSGPGYGDSYERQNLNETNLSVLSKNLTLCQTALTDLEKGGVKELKHIKDNRATMTQAIEEEESIPLTRERKPSTQEMVHPAQFEVKRWKYGKIHQKLNLTVDTHSGKLIMVAATDHTLGENNTVKAEKIYQLVKNSSNSNRLDVLIKDRKKKTFLFDDVKQREHFCQMVQAMKNMHSKSEEIDQISVFVGSFNMGDEPPNWNLRKWLRSLGVGKTRAPALSMLPHDIYVIGTQETGIAEDKLGTKLKDDLLEIHGIHFKVVVSASLWGIRIVVLVKPEYEKEITNVNHSTVKTGIANKLGNKGAVGVSFFFKGTSFCFVNAHLTSGHEKNARRNQNFKDIIRGLSLGHKKQGTFDTTNRFHHLFFFGDLNYRLHGLEPTEIIKRIAHEKKAIEKNYYHLLTFDQLKGTQTNNEAFVEFSEEEITFPPTYRFDRTTVDRYVWQKVKRTGTRINAPSWCDRVLWRSYPDLYCQNTSYGMDEEMCTSDHKPVFSSFDIGIDSQFASKGESSCGDVAIVFSNITAELKTSAGEQFIVEFHSTCLKEPVQTTRQTKIQHGETMSREIFWKGKNIPELKPLFEDRAYLETQHILIAVRDTESMESYGECVISLVNMFSVKPQAFQCVLTHHGERTGELSGKMHVKSLTNLQMELHPKRHKSYELIYTDIQLLSKSPTAASNSTVERSVLSVPGISYYGSSSFMHNDTASDSAKTPVSSVNSNSPPAPSSAGTPAEPVPRPRPRLGQSSLGVVSRESNSHDKLSKTQSKRGNCAQTKEREMPMYYKSESEESNKGNSKTVEEPRKPVPPPRKINNERRSSQPAEGMLYESLDKPRNVKQWLTGIGLAFYQTAFMDNGWDSMDFMGSVTVNDLIELKVNDPEHRQRILNSLEKL